MNYGQVKRRALALAQQYSIAGVPVKESYNNQADALLKLPDLVNDAQLLIATTARPIPAAAALETLDREEQGSGTLYWAPYDLWQVRGSGVLDLTGPQPRRLPVLAWLGERQFLLEADAPDGAVLEYYRYPHSLGDAPGDDAPLDNVPEAQAAAAFYAAAHLVRDDDANAYSALYNEFEARLARLTAPVAAEQAEVTDAYGGLYDGVV